MKITIYSQKMIVLVAIVCLTILSIVSSAKQTVSDETLEAALNDKRYLTRQLKCALGEGTCDPVGRKLKAYAPLILRGSCTQCTPTEVRQVQKVLSHIQRNYPKEWTKMLKQYNAVSSPAPTPTPAPPVKQ